MHDPEIAEIVRARSILQSKHFELKIIQEPDDCRALAKQEKSRGAKWPLDPPPVIELILDDGDPNRNYLHSPFWFCTAELKTVSSTGGPNQPKGLVGTTVSSLHKVKLQDNKERGFFIFGDLNVRNPGTHFLTYKLFEMRQGPDCMYAELLNKTDSKQFKVHPSKTHLPIRESTPLSRQLCEAGVKLRIRKESQKRKHPVVEWAADRSQFLPHSMTMFPRPSMAPLSRMMPPRAVIPSHSTGENIAHRLSFSTGNALGIRHHLDRMTHTKPDDGLKSLDAWTTGPPSWPLQSWSYDSSQPAYSMPPASSGYEIRSGYSAFSDGGYHGSQHAIPPSAYAFSAHHSQLEPNQSRGPGSSLYMDSNPFVQTHSTDGGISGAAHSDSEHVQHYDIHHFTTSASMASGFTDQNAYSMEQRALTLPSAGGGPDHYG